MLIVDEGWLASMMEALADISIAPGPHVVSFLRYVKLTTVRLLL